MKDFLFTWYNKIEAFDLAVRGHVTKDSGVSEADSQITRHSAPQQRKCSGVEYTAVTLSTSSLWLLAVLSRKASTTHSSALFVVFNHWHTATPPTCPRFIWPLHWKDFLCQLGNIHAIAVGWLVDQRFLVSWVFWQANNLWFYIWTVGYTSTCYKSLLVAGRHVGYYLIPSLLYNTIVLSAIQIGLFRVTIHDCHRNCSTMKVSHKKQTAVFCTLGENDQIYLWLLITAKPKWLNLKYCDFTRKIFSLINQQPWCIWKVYVWNMTQPPFWICPLKSTNDMNENPWTRVQNKVSVCLRRTPGKTTPRTVMWGEGHTRKTLWKDIVSFTKHIQIDACIINVCTFHKLSS